MRFYQQSHQFYCGVDRHASSMYVCIVDHEGQTKVHTNIDACPDRFLPLMNEARLRAPHSPRRFDGLRHFALRARRG